MCRYIGWCLLAGVLLTLSLPLTAANRYKLVFKNGNSTEIADCRRDGEYTVVTNAVGHEFKFVTAEEIDVEKTLEINPGNAPPCFTRPRVSVPTREEYRAVHFDPGSSDWHCTGRLIKRPGGGFFYEGEIRRGGVVMASHKFPLPLDQIAEVREDSFYEKWKGAGRRTWVREKRAGAVRITMKSGEIYEMNYHIEPGKYLSYPPLISLFPSELVKQTGRETKKAKTK